MGEGRLDQAYREARAAHRALLFGRHARAAGGVLIIKAMVIKRASGIRSSEITDKKLYYNRRQFMQAAAGTAAAVAAGTIGSDVLSASTPAAHGKKLDGITERPFRANPAIDKTNPC